MAVAVAAALAFAGVTPVRATSWEATLLAADRLGSDFFGEAVAMSGPTVVVGAKLQDAGGFDRGAAYVFERSGTAWTQQAKLRALDAANSDQFGTAVAVSDDTIVVGAPMDDDAGTSSGSAYVFTRSGTAWTQQAKLTAPDAALADEFGGAVAVSGDTVVVGARRHDHGVLDAGSAYVFTRSNGAWQFEIELRAGDAQTGDLLGHSVALSGDTALVGALGDDDRGAEAGAAYVFSRGPAGWAPGVKVLAPDGAPADSFGHAVSLSSETALIAAMADDDDGRNTGSAYVLRRTAGGWVHEAKLRAADPETDAFFGRGAAIDGNAAIVGASLYDNVFRDAGAAYVFERLGGQWVQTAKLAAPQPAEADLLGHSVAIDGDSGVVGVPLDDDRANATGSAHVFVGLADVTAPTIEAEVEPPPNAAGWHSSAPVEVSFSCADAGSGIASCTGPTSLVSEPGATVTGVAVDMAGNTASLDVEVRIDLTPATVAVDDPSPIPGVPVPVSLITGSAVDGLSGVSLVEVTFRNVLTSAEVTRVAALDGAAWSVSAADLAPGPTSASATATDIAGNVTANPATLLFIAAP